MSSHRKGDLSAAAKAEGLSPEITIIARGQALQYAEASNGLRDNNGERNSGVPGSETVAGKSTVMSELGRSVPLFAQEYRVGVEKTTKRNGWTEVGSVHSVRRTAHSSGGLKSLWRSIGECHIQERGGNSSRAVLVDGGQGVRREVESEGFAEKCRAVINGSHPEDEPVGQRWGKVEPALWRRRRSQSPIEPRCLRAARYGRTVSDSGRTHSVPEWHRDKQTYKLKAKWNAKPDE